MSLIPIDPTNAVAVTDYLTKARDWLATAVENTGPEQIAAAKAEIATAAEATKQLGLSKEIQHDAAEMVRRAEWTLRRATKKAQDAGDIRSREQNLIPGGPSAGSPGSRSSSLPSAADFFSGKQEYEDANSMAELDARQFDEVIEEAKAEGNLSRANVARKAREKAGHTPEPAAAGSTERAHQEAELVNAFGSIVRRSLTPKNVATLTPKARARLISILNDALNTLQETSS